MNTPTPSTMVLSVLIGGCPIENEYWADIVELHVFPDNGRKDLIDENWSDLFYDNRRFDE